MHCAGLFFQAFSKLSRNKHDTLPPVCPTTTELSPKNHMEGKIVAHYPVLLNESIKLLQIAPDGVYVDCTGGGGGHSSAILKHLDPNKGRLIILDQDTHAIERLNTMFADNRNVDIVHSAFQHIDTVLLTMGIDRVNGIFADLGMSTFQLQDASRGFSFQHDGPLDMRMNLHSETSAAHIVNQFSENNLREILHNYSEERFANSIARNIVKQRLIKQITTTRQLADIVRNSIPRKFHKPGIHPATKTFQALRIFINKELDALQSLMHKSSTVVAPGGVIAIISFHSLEDRIVKETFAYASKECICPVGLPLCSCDKEKTLEIITKKPIIPTEQEVMENKASRSAKLRGARVLV